MIEVLEFNAKVRINSTKDAREASSYLSNDSLALLIEGTLQFMRDDVAILTDPYPERHRRFNCIKLTHLLEPPTEEDSAAYRDLKVRYFTGLADVMIDQYTEHFETGKLDTWVMSAHLVNSLDHEYVP